MRRLSALDTSFLVSEDGRRHNHVCTMSVLDAAITVEDVRKAFRDRLAVLGPFRSRLVSVPGNLGYPYWTPCDVDLDRHVREMPMPATGPAAAVGAILETPLDRRFPLWEAYLLGGTILVVKVHHALTDGVSGVVLLRNLFSDAFAPLPPQSGAVSPSSLRLLIHGLADLAGQPLRSASALATLRRVPAQVPAPISPFTATLSPRRHVAFASLPLEEIAAARARFGATVNDVFVAVCASALRHWLEVHAHPTWPPLVAMVPVARTSDGHGANQVSAFRIPLATDEPNGYQRMARTVDQLTAAKQRYASLGGRVVEARYAITAPPLQARAARRRAKRAVAAPPYNVVLSSVRGPSQRLNFAGRCVLSCHPVSAIVHGAGLNISALSYADQLEVGLIADPRLVPDITDLADWVETALVELTASAGSPNV
jgi:WS/DGAT/MGAT family acyltransferase